MKDRHGIQRSGVEGLLAAVLSPSEREVFDKGVFKGKVLDSASGKRLFGVVVELIGTGRTYITSPSGYFKFTDIPEGMHLARFSFPGSGNATEIFPVRKNGETDVTVELKLS